jgi:hypothetical protein
VIPDPLRGFLPADTAATWERIQPIVPEAAYLVGGTAITARMQHRISQDLDFFLDSDVDLTKLASTLADHGDFAVTARAEGTLNGVFSKTRVQFLDARQQRAVDSDETIGGLRVASMRDLVAMKLKVIGDRGELRDYFDLMAIEVARLGSAEGGLADFLARYRPEDDNAALIHVIEALGYLDDVDEDELVPAAKADVEGYWRRRQPQVLRAAGRL